MAKKKVRCWAGSNLTDWTLSQIPISPRRILERKKNPHHYLHDMEYKLEVKPVMCDAITLTMTDQELVDLIVNAELMLKQRSLPQ